MDPCRWVVLPVTMCHPLGTAACFAARQAIILVPAVLVRHDDGRLGRCARGLQVVLPASHVVLHATGSQALLGWLCYQPVWCVACLGRCARG